MPMDRERRKEDPVERAKLRAELNEDQRIALSDLERFGWELKFIRHPLFAESVPVVFDPDRKSYAVILADGTLDEHPGFDIRG
jgi:hypothetical protein